jgi:hypothetical protein
MALAASRAANAQWAAREAAHRKVSIACLYSYTYAYVVAETPPLADA